MSKSLSKWYWIGKQPKVKNAVNYYLKNIGQVHSFAVCEKFNISEKTLYKHVVALREIGLAPPRFYGRIPFRKTEDS